jgi:hypothetical protein
MVRQLWLPTCSAQGGACVAAEHHSEMCMAQCDASNSGRGARMFTQHHERLLSCQPFVKPRCKLLLKRTTYTCTEPRSTRCQNAQQARDHGCHACTGQLAYRYGSLCAKLRCSYMHIAMHRPRSRRAGGATGTDANMRVGTGVSKHRCELPPETCMLHNKTNRICISRSSCSIPQLVRNARHSRLACRRVCLLRLVGMLRLEASF